MFKKLLLASFVLVTLGGLASAQVMQGGKEKKEDTKKEPTPIYLADYDVTKKDYIECTSKIINGSPAGYIACLNKEMKRQHTYIENFYRTLLKQDDFKKWNGGDTLSKGNFKDMNDQFVAFRDRLCSLYAVGKMSFYGNIEWGRKDCMVNFNDFMLGKLQEIKDGANQDFPIEDDREWLNISE